MSFTSSTGSFVNTGTGPTLQPIDIGHSEYLSLIDPDTAFWLLVKRERLAEALTDNSLMKTYRRKAKEFADEMNQLRFFQRPSAVYFNPTERCNLNCSYCYIPEEMRRDGRHMSEKSLLDALSRLKNYFSQTLPQGAAPQIVFHGAEPLLNRDAVFAGIEQFKNDFRFGVQTNATVL